MEITNLSVLNLVIRNSRLFLNSNPFILSFIEFIFSWRFRKVLADLPGDHIQASFVIILFIVFWLKCNQILLLDKKKKPCKKLKGQTWPITLVCLSIRM